MTTTVVIVPVIIFAMMFVVQFGLAYHARQVLAGATRDGAAAAARRGSSPGAGVALTDELIDEAASSLFSSHTTNASAGANTVTVTATGHVVRVLPFFGSPTVRASATAHIESFDPQGQTP